MLRHVHPHAGYALALLASVLLLGDGILLLITFALVLAYSGLHFPALQHLFYSTPLPFAIYALWAVGVAGSVAAISAIILYGFRERWFWRCMVTASALWLLFPPLHAIIGLISLIVLLRFRSSFPKTLAESEPPP